MNILVVYYAPEYPMRVSVKDHLRSFERYSGADCYYLNLADPRTPRSVLAFEPDLVVFHTILLSQRMNPEHWAGLVRKMDFLRASRAAKVMLPQDEYVHADLLVAFARDFGVSHIFSCGQPDVWPVFYPGLAEEGVTFSTVLTGYLSEDTVRRIERLAADTPERDLAIGYRAWYPWPCLGRHAQLKGLIGDVFKAKARERGLAVDISNDLADTFLGDAWYEFLLRCRYTLGVEGGASILDFDGALMRRTNAYMAEHPGAAYENVEQACFPGLGDELSYFAVSPRHLEAVATRTCQILVEGDYNGVLEPHVHYIPLKRDLSDADDVLDAVQRDDLRVGIVERAYEDVIRSGRWTYESFVRTVVAQAAPVQGGRVQRSVVVRGAIHDRWWWFVRATKYRVRRAASAVLGEERLLATTRRLRGLTRRERA